MRTYLSILFLLLLSLPSFAESQEEATIQIKGYVDSFQWEKAQSELDRFLTKNPNDATLQLYQNFVWIGKADLAYSNRKFLTAFGYYEKVFKSWPSHPGVRSRYLELKSREDLKDLQEEPKVAAPIKENRNFSENISKTSGNSTVRTVFVFDPSLQESSAKIKFEYEELLKGIEEAKKKTKGNVGSTATENRDLRFVWMAIGALALLTLVNTVLLVRNRKT
ncbi:hypothetical protein EHO61_05285 [Leptospira fluminis]|uniref:Tetratricopeptide repeat protein n=1 Tax=Leptospira fluminis TaxID=2484979 RepID=A0A4R9GR98_9LEPT|nr:hypothetical protein [Leptospira fluminis]TGK20298.1 hypothetical protein EHO61_05285 [Leptospira fluminis]